VTKDKLKIHAIHKLNTTQKKTNDTKYCKTKLPCLLWHLATKRGGLILQCPQAHVGH